MGKLILAHVKPAVPSWLQVSNLFGEYSATCTESRLGGRDTGREQRLATGWAAPPALTCAPEEGSVCYKAPHKKISAQPAGPSTPIGADWNG